MVENNISMTRTPAVPGVLDDPMRSRGVAFTAAGIDPCRVIPVSLDVGTGNEGPLNDPQYLGNRHARVRGAAYDAFIRKYLEGAWSLFPGALLHFEDFGGGKAGIILRAPVRSATCPT